MKDKLIIIGGPTAVGKTEISIKLAQILNGEIISADSMQIYRDMNIGSAKISYDEMQGIPHHMIDIVDPTEEFSVSEYKLLAKAKIREIISKGKIPIIVGGTGLYIDSLIRNYSYTEGFKDENFRVEMETLALEKGNVFLHSMLKDIDLESYKNIHPNNRKRVIRALEVYKITGKPFSSFKENEGKVLEEYDIYYYVLTMNREKLYERINRRVDVMIENGLLEEVKHLKDKGMTPDMQSMKGIGYKELLYYLNGDISLEKAIDMLKQGTRNYAKRQLTWFRRDSLVEFINKDVYNSEEEIINKILNDIGEY